MAHDHQHGGPAHRDHQHGRHEHHQHQHQHGGGDAADVAAMAEMLDLDAEVLHSYLSDLTAWIRELAGERPPRRILDLGSGTGAGSFALLERFDGTEVIALDASEPMLRHLEAAARERGLADRIRTVQADLDASRPELEPVDLVWASASLHHMADPDRVLADVLTMLRPDGLMIAVEPDAFPRFLPDDLGFGRPGLEERCHAAMAEWRAAQMPHFGADWGPLLAKAGFSVEAERVFTIDLTPPLPDSAGRYAQASLRRMRTGLDGVLDSDDLAALDRLLDDDGGPGSVLRRDDLHVRARRMAWAARRPQTT
ncbi:trans-aconitate 2-methyltransferase [Nonomuraea sp. MTCD27]|uniref:class I SAM-dependent methyltransferase n=1 Tax=Nonomuraea sp. MTCD27 TaxID=1676747 RepID=UPI0035BFF454